MTEELLSKAFYGNTIGAWALAALMVLGSVVLAKIAYWIFGNIAKKATERTETRLDDIIIDMIEEPIVLAIVLAGSWMATKTLTLGPILSAILGKGFYIATVINLAWLATRTFDSIVEEYIVPMVEKSDGELDDQLLPIIRKGAKLTVWIVAIVVGMDNAGYDIGALLAGLGIGGLAFALAAQDTVANLFGGITIFADRPFTVHDRVIVGGYEGFVREIGLRSTRIEKLDGRMVTVPNSMVANNYVENVSSANSWFVLVGLGLTYDMGTAKIATGLETLEAIVREVEGITKVRIVFSSFGDSSLNLELAYLIAPEFDPFEKQSEMNFEILRRFEDEGLEFAFPSQTLYNVSVPPDSAAA